MASSQASSTSRARGEIPDIPSQTWWDRLWARFWMLPLWIVIGALILGFALPMLDKALSGVLPFIFEGGPDGARAILTTIATAMISVTGLVFSITMVVLQLASSQFTPRVLGTFLSSRITQATLGVFTASFVFALTVLRSVRGEETNSIFVPQLSVSVAFLLVLASVGLFLAFIHHITSSIQVTNVIAAIGSHTLKLTDRLYPVSADEQDNRLGRTWSPEAGTSRQDVIAVERHGYISYINYSRLIDLARELDAVISVGEEIGTYVVEDQKLAHVWGARELDESDLATIGRCITLDSDRSMYQEVGFGMRQLVDIAEKALSPGVNDPTTATQVIHQIHRILRVLVRRASPSPYLIDDEEVVRVVHRPQLIEDLIALSGEEIEHYASESVQVPRRLREMYTDLLEIADPRYRPALQRRLEVLDETCGTLQES